MLYSIGQMSRETEWSHSYACEGSFMRGVVDHSQPPDRAAIAGLRF